MFPLAQTIDRSISGGSNGSKPSNRAFYSVRVLLVTVTTASGIFLRDFGTFMALIGYPCLGVLGLVLPGYMACKNLTLSPVMEGFCWYGLYLGGIIFSVVGTIASILELIAGEI